jgi:hypothetical protein
MMNLVPNFQGINAGSFGGLPIGALSPASAYGNNAASMFGFPGESTLFSNEAMATPQLPQADFDGLASFSSAWGLNPNTATATSPGLFCGSAQPSALEAIYQQTLTCALMSMMASLMGQMNGLNGLANGQNPFTLGGADGGLGNDTGGLNGADNGLNGADKIDIPKGGTLSGTQLVDVLKQAGFSGEGLKMAWAIAMRESGGKPGAFNGNAGTGDKSYGLFQINMLGSLGPARLKELGLNSNEDLLDPLTNAKAAFKMSKGGKDFGAWAVGPNAYRHSAALDAAIEKYLKQFPG